MATFAEICSDSSKRGLSGIGLHDQGAHENRQDGRRREGTHGTAGFRAVQILRHCFLWSVFAIDLERGQFA